MKCLNCGKFTMNPKFCSSSCSAKYNNRNFPKRSRKKYYCKSCGVEIGYRRSYCSECNPTRLHDFNNVTIAEIRSRARYQAHAWIRKLARRVFDNSDLEKCCYKCGYSRHFEICHVKAIQDFPSTATMAEVNSLENLVALCPNCHWELDHGLLSL